MGELRLGLIGCGGIGEVHAGCVAKIPQGEFIAYCDIDEAVAKRVLDKFGGEELPVARRNLTGREHQVYRPQGRDVRPDRRRRARKLKS